MAWPGEWKDSEQVKGRDEGVGNGEWREEAGRVDALWDVTRETNFPLEMRNKNENWTHKVNFESGTY